MQKYEALLAAEDVQASAEIHAYVLSQMADAEMELGAYREAERQARESVRILTGAGKQETSALAASEGSLAAALRAEGSYAEAKKLAEHALALGRRTFAAQAPRLGVLLTILAGISLDVGDRRRALDLCREAVHVFEQAEASRLELGGAYQNLAIAYASRGKSREALQAINQALAVWKQVLPANHPFFVYALGTQAMVYYKLKAFRQADEVLPEMLRLAETQFDANHPERLLVLNEAAVVYTAEKKYEQAEPLLRAALAIEKRQLPAGHPSLRNTLLNYVYVLERLNRKQEAALYRAESQVLLAFPKRPPS